jgi:ketosteroid isomerase-like protein
MTNRLRAFALASISILLSAAASANEGTVSPAHLDVLAKHRSDHVAAVLAGDADSLVRQYSGNVRVMPEYHGTLFGNSAARAYHAAFFERFDVQHLDRKPLRTYDLGSRVVEIGRFTERLTTTADGRTHELIGKYIDIWEKTGGSLVLATHGWNYDRYPEIADSLRFGSIPGTRTAMEARAPINDSVSFELAALNKLQEAAIQQRDDGVWVQFFAADAVLLPNHHGPLQGKAEIEAYIEEHSRQLSIFEKLDIRNDRIDVSGRYVIDYASHVANWRNGANSGVNTGKNVRIWRREPGGTLKMICQIGMYD